ncbi:unnamed protein product [Cuscuta epithymum]|uniref:Uncharacterized protein n=1 Tax=Cuscuta epithymum TaxID=186058 RepID=A0AAV0CB56_9ASTE|nr:unnamed protein product [Cuscuta epithymum]
MKIHYSITLLLFVIRVVSITTFMCVDNIAPAAGRGMNGTAEVEDEHASNSIAAASNWTQLQPSPSSSSSSDHGGYKTSSGATTSRLILLCICLGIGIIAGFVICWCTNWCRACRR